MDFWVEICMFIDHMDRNVTKLLQSESALIENSDLYQMQNNFTIH